MTAQLQPYRPLWRDDHQVNHKRVMRENDLLAGVTRRVKTTNNHHSYGRHPNLVKDLTVVRPDQVWCSDITYIQLP